MERLKLNWKEVLLIEECTASLKEWLEWKNVVWMLLKDWIEVLKNNNFFASSSVFFVFIEKFLREEIISLGLEEWRQENPWNLNDRFYALDSIEEKFEDWKNENNKFYWFYSYWKILKDKLWSDLYKKLKKIYSKNRNNVQHWIYWRIAKSNFWINKIPVHKFNIDINSPELKIQFKSCVDAVRKREPDLEIPISNLMFRQFQLPDFLKNLSLELLTLITEIVDVFADKE